MDRLMSDEKYIEGSEMLNTNTRELHTLDETTIGSLARCKPRLRAETVVTVIG